MSATMLQKVLDVLNDAPGYSDERMNKFLLRSPLQLITLMVAYLAFVTHIGPKFMKDRKPYPLKSLIILYNLSQIVANSFVFYKSLDFWKYSNFYCTPSDVSKNAENFLEIRLHYYYILLKYYDLVETVFYVLRKKNQQASFLHVYHHLGILLAAWISGKYFPGGQAYFVGLFNSFTHAIMYCYYLASSANSEKVKQIWWKKYLTMLQITQQCLIFISVFPSVINPNCSYSKFWMGLFSCNVMFLIYLFVKFYKNTYLKKVKNY